MKKKLNLGCGKGPRKNYLNVDIFEEEGVDMVHDLNKIPYPFEDNRFEEILMKDVLEHLDRPVKVLEEVLKISKKGAQIKISVPHCKCTKAWADPTHTTGFAASSFDHYDKRYSDYRGTLEHKRLSIHIEKVTIVFPRIYHKLGIAR